MVLAKKNFKTLTTKQMQASTLISLSSEEIDADGSFLNHVLTNGIDGVLRSYLYENIQSSISKLLFCWWN